MKSLISYTELLQLVADGVINAPIENVNGASIDVTLDKIIRIEETDKFFSSPVNLAKKESINTIEIEMGEEGYILCSGDFILASTQETFNLPNDIAAEYKLKSTMARNGLEHLNAGWCDPGWNGSKLTLELQNITQYHDLIIAPGMKIGQIVFFRCEPVPDHASYAVKGQYNGQEKVQESKGIR